MAFESGAAAPSRTRLSAGTNSGRSVATKLDKASVEKLNAAIRGYNHDDGTRKSILGANGLPDDASAPKDAVNLNNLDDWKEFHEAALK